MANIEHIRAYVKGKSPGLAPAGVSGFLAWGQRQGIAPLAYLTVKFTLFDTPELRAERMAYMAHCAQVRGTQMALAQAVEALQQAGVATLCFKGPALAAQYWPVPLARRYADLDLLCLPEKAKAAEEVLMGLGYDYRYSTQRELIAPMERRKKAVIYQRGTTVLDLHYSPPLGCMAAADSLESLFRRAVLFRLSGGQAVPTLSPEDTLLMLAWHGGAHLYHKLNQVLDVFFLLQNTPSLDWDYVQRNARRNSLSKSLALALELVRRLLGHDARRYFPVDKLPNASRLADLVIRRVIESPRPEPGIALALRIRAGQARGLRHFGHEIYANVFSPQLADALYAGRRLPMPVYGLCRFWRLVIKGRNNV